ncbi:hypothetical protein WDW37_18005 [Bdellovibrionota bacterium FG-1]
MRPFTGESATQFINNNFFGTRGELRKDFSRLFKSLFDEYRKHVAVIRALAAHPSGYTHQELLGVLQLPGGGRFSEALEELEESHFIQFTPKLGNKKKEGVYRLIDRKDDTINLCEMKYTGSVFKLTATEAKKIRDRKDELLSIVKKGTSVIVILVTPLPVSKTMAHYTGLIDDQVNLDAFFKN